MYITHYLSRAFEILRFNDNEEFLQKNIISSYNNKSYIFNIDTILQKEKGFIMQKRTVTIIKKVTTEYKMEITTSCSDAELNELFNEGELDNDWKEIDGTTDSELVSIEEVN